MEQYIYQQKEQQNGGTLYKITYDIIDGDITNIAVTTVYSDTDTDVETISADESYIGYYTDVDGDGKVDGV